MELLWDNLRIGYTRVFLKRNKVRRLPDEYQVIYVLDGTAWITQDDIDLIVESGKQIVVHPGKYPALISAVGRLPLVYEIRPEERYQGSMSLFSQSQI